MNVNYSFNMNQKKESLYKMEIFEFIWKFHKMWQCWINNDKPMSSISLTSSVTKVWGWSFHVVHIVSVRLRGRITPTSIYIF